MTHMADEPIKETPERPLVSFIVFAYNQENYVRDAVAGAFAQTYTPIELILSDDCSTDRTFEVMQDMAAQYSGSNKIRVRRNERNLGFAEHINAVVSFAGGEIICWAAGDDISLPERTRLLIEPFLRDPQVYGTHSQFYRMDIDGTKRDVPVCDAFVREFTVDKIIKHDYRIVAQTHMFRKKVFDFFGPLLPTVTNEGAVMAFREAALGTIVFVDEPTILYRVGSGTSTYGGQDVGKLKRDEPLKVVGWSLGFYDQLLVDLQKLHHLDTLYRDIAYEKQAYYRLLSQINSSPWQVRALVEILRQNAWDATAIRAFVRTNVPSSIYKIVIAMGLKSQFRNRASL